MPMHVAKKSLLIYAAVILLVPHTIFAQEAEKKSENEKESTTLRIQVTGSGQESEGPVEGAEVYVRSEEEAVEYEREVTTNNKGVARLLDVPRGKVLIQVTAEEWVPFGGRFDLEKKDQTIDIKMKKTKEEDRN